MLERISTAMKPSVIASYLFLATGIKRSLSALLVLGIAQTAWAAKANQDLELGMLARVQLEDHRGISQAETLSLQEAAGLPLFRVFLQGQLAPRAEIYVALHADDIRLQLAEANVGYLLTPQPASALSDPRTGRGSVRSTAFRGAGQRSDTAPGFWLHLGRMPESYGLQSQTRPEDRILSASHIASSQLANHRYPEGIRLSQLSDDVTTQLGIFRDHQVSVVSSDDQPWSAALRLAGRSALTDYGQFQVGFSLGLKDIFVGSRWRETDMALDEGFAHSALISPVSLFKTEANAVDSEQRGALEFVWHRKGFTLQTESFYRQINAVHDGVDASLNGHYVELSWLTKGERRAFNNRGILNHARPQGAWGSFEWVAGVDSVTMHRSDTDASSRAYDWFLGHNWYANPNVKLYSLWRYTDAGAAFTADGNDGYGHGVRLGAQLTL